jgi:hypothetical protein
MKDVPKIYWNPDAEHYEVKEIREVHAEINTVIHFPEEGKSCIHKIDPNTNASELCKYGWQYVRATKMSSSTR